MRLVGRSGFSRLRWCSLGQASSPLPWDAGSGLNRTHGLKSLPPGMTRCYSV